ncbi:peptidase M29 [Paenibacillus sp. BIHB 4019]|uniref:Peptidase M29 n=1 Tax=Paenibacillus sp. BIHB 4019 TaxID=1870819 RepID=A0A1B2DIB0_9BACL|nr:aminopeptidase [Paenibacillus sp. BIHB 4019]ANY67452.1 peptidase M29 [Paenibacillus sp. BIHB 4019]
MSDAFVVQLEKYAEIIVKIGVNVQQGQAVFVTGAIEAAPLVRLVAEKAYAAGASNVHIDWTDDQLSRLKYEKAGAEIFEHFPQWETAKRQEFVDKGAAFISIVSSSPDLLKGIDTQRISNYQKAAGAGLKEFRRAIQADKVSWTVVAAAAKDWAKKVFPQAEGEQAVELLWEAIFKAVRLHAEDPVAAWQEHNRALGSKGEALNNYHFNKLHYTAPGTDLTIELHDKHLWVAAGSENEQDVPFMANMPTEEVFTVPLKTGVNGYVSSTKPLSYGGNIIDRFKLTFENGRIVKAEAEEGEAILQKLIDTDEGARYLGEVALVPHHSPISESNILFYNTLFDENASNHLAIGSGYAFNIEGGKKMSPEELEANGVNASLTHNDFMIGSADMDIDGIQADGTVVPVFRKGNWAF